MSTVENVDYNRLVEEIADAGPEGVTGVLLAEVRELPPLRTSEESSYFLRRVVMTASSNEKAWLALVELPGVQRMIPSGTPLHTSPGDGFELSLPKLGSEPEEPPN